MRDKGELSYDWIRQRWVLRPAGTCERLYFPGPDGPSLLTVGGVLYVNGRPWCEWLA